MVERRRPGWVDIHWCRIRAKMDKHRELVVVEERRVCRSKTWMIILEYERKYPRTKVNCFQTKRTLMECDFFSHYILKQNLAYPNLLIVDSRTSEKQTLTNIVIWISFFSVHNITRKRTQWCIANQNYLKIFLPKQIQEHTSRLNVLFFLYRLY